MHFSYDLWNTFSVEYCKIWTQALICFIVLQFYGAPEYLNTHNHFQSYWGVKGYGFVFPFEVLLSNMLSWEILAPSMEVEKNSFLRLSGKEIELILNKL